MGIHTATIVKAPFTMPEPPMPATALPTMNIFEDVATPQMREPNSKSAKKNIKVIAKNVSYIYLYVDSGSAHLRIESAVDFASYWLQRAARFSEC
jgi:hypothetical protein